ncbi:hypothetical protein BDW69DRAFT_190733 [Aspergillus filifer]
MVAVVWDSAVVDVVWMLAAQDTERVRDQPPITHCVSWTCPSTNAVCNVEGGCIQAGGGGGVGSEDTNPDKSSTSCTSTTSPIVTTICDYACKDTSDTCSTLCTSLTMTEACEPTAGSANLQIGNVIADNVGDAYEASDEDIKAEGNSLASWLNPFYTDWDPVLISGTTLTISATPPNVATNTATKTTQIAILAPYPSNPHTMPATVATACLSPPRPMPGTQPT